MDDYFIGSSLAPSHNRIAMDVPGNVEKPCSTLEQKLLQKTVWNPESGGGIKSGSGRNDRKYGKPPRPPKHLSVHHVKIHKSQDHTSTMQCQVLLRRSKIEGKSLTNQEKLNINPSDIVFNTLAALLLIFSLLLFTFGQGHLPSRIPRFAQLKAFPHMLQGSFFMKNFPKLKLEYQQPQDLNSQVIPDLSLSNSILSSAVERPYKYGSQIRGLFISGIHVKDTNPLLEKAKLRLKRLVLN